MADQEAPPPVRTRRAWRWVLVLPVLLIATLLIALWGLDTTPGHRFLADRIAALPIKSGLKIRIGRIDGSIYGRARLHDLRLSDPQGLFFSAPDAALDWTPTAWLRNRLDITALTARTATLHRLPKLRKTGAKTVLPGFDIRIGRLAIDRLAIDRGVAGPPRVGALAAAADVRDGRAMVDGRLSTSAGDRLLLRLDAEPDRDRFDLGAAVDAPAGGVLGKLLGATRPVSARVGGKGSWTIWTGSAEASVGGGRVAALALAVTKGCGSLDGRLFLTGITKGRLQRLSAGGVRIKGAGTLANRILDGRLSVASAAIAISATGALDLARSAYDAVKIDARLFKPAAMIKDMEGRDIALKMLLDGGFGDARFRYLLTSPYVRFDGKTGFETVRAEGRGRLSPSPVIVPIRLTARRMTGEGDVAGGILANLVIDGKLRVTGKAITGDGLRLRSDKLSSTLTLFLDLGTGEYQVGFTGQLTRYLIPGFGIVDVRSSLNVVPGPNRKGTRVTGRAQAWVRRFDNAFLASLAGGLPRLETGLERGNDGILKLTGLRIVAPQLTLSGNGYRRKDGSFYFEGGGRQGAYGAVRLTLDGRIERPKLDLFLPRPVDALGLADVRLLLDPTAAGFDYRAAGGSRLGPFTSNGAIMLPKGHPAHIAVAVINVAGTRASGDLVSMPGGFDGRLAVNGGGLSGDLRFDRLGKLQRIAISLDAKDAKLALTVPVSIRRGGIDGEVVLDSAGTSVKATVTARGLRRGALSLAQLAADVDMKGGTGQVKAAVAGSRGRAFDLQTVAQVSPDRISLVGVGAVDRRPIKLDSAAVLTRDGGGWRLAPTALSFAGGTAQVGGRFGGGDTAFEATVAAMPLSVLDLAYPDLDLGGVASGRVAYRTGGGAPGGSIDVTIRGLSRSGLVLSSQPIDVGLKGVLSGSSAAVRAVAASGGKTVGRAQARLAPLGATGDLADRLAAAPLFAQLRYNGSADTLWRLTGIETFDLSGPVAIGADVGGSLNNPRIRGSLKTDNARLESPVAGTVLTGVKAIGRFGGSRLVIDSFAATAGSGGSVTGAGSFDLAARNGVGMDLALQAQNAVLLNRDDIGATVTGPLTIRSDGAGGVIAGEVALDRSRFRLGRARAAQGVPRLTVKEINRPVDEEALTAPPVAWRLDLKAKARNRLAVTGLGLDSEWRADLAITGTLTEPVLLGRADLLRGGYEFAGRRFDLERGTIRFNGANPPDPALDIAAEANLQGFNATIRVTGTGLKPEISFASVPALPEDELLSRLLFGTSITNLSAPEALQLASAVASLQTDGGLDPINAVRRAVGLDRLRILPADPTVRTGTAIAAGKYLTRRTFVEVISDGQGYSATRIEFQITRWLSLLSSISTIGRQSANVRVSKDY